MGDDTVQRAVNETTQNLELDRVGKLAQAAHDKAEAAEKQLLLLKGAGVVVSFVFTAALTIIGWIVA